MKTFHSILFAGLGLLFLGGTPVHGAEVAKAGAPKIIAVKFHADWCGVCKAMGPVFTDLHAVRVKRGVVRRPRIGYKKKVTR